MELRCPSLDYVYSMTWAEFQIRAFAYRRMQEREELLAREIAWNSLLAPHYNPKKLPKDKNKFWQIGTKKVSKADEAMKQAIERARNEYFKKQKELNG